MNTNEILEIIKQFDQSSMTKLSFSKGELSLDLEKDTEISKGISTSTIPTPVEILNEVETVEVMTGHEISAPIVGIFYEAPSPDKPAFVSIGDTVKKGQVLCIIEAMKVMNEVVSDKAGKVLAIHGVDGELVEYGQPLFVLE